MLAVCRRLVWQHSNVVAGRWRGNAVQNVQLFELKGRTLGIVAWAPSARRPRALRRRSA